jgi:hypothetical protein
MEGPGTPTPRPAMCRSWSRSRARRSARWAAPRRGLLNDLDRACSPSGAGPSCLGAEPLGLRPGAWRRATRCRILRTPAHAIGGRADPTGGHFDLINKRDLGGSSVSPQLRHRQPAPGRAPASIRPFEPLVAAEPLVDAGEEGDSRLALTSDKRSLPLVRPFTESTAAAHPRHARRPDGNRGRRG